MSEPVQLTPAFPWMDLFFPVLSALKLAPTVASVGTVVAPKATAAVKPVIRTVADVATHGVTVPDIVTPDFGTIDFGGSSDPAKTHLGTYVVWGGLALLAGVIVAKKI